MEAETFAWHRSPSGGMTALFQDIRVVVHEANGFARYLLVARPHSRGEPSVLLESGCEDDIGAAKRKTRRRAACLAALVAAHWREPQAR